MTLRLLPCSETPQVMRPAPRKIQLLPSGGEALMDGQRSQIVSTAARHVLMIRKHEDDKRRLRQAMLKAHNGLQKAFTAERVQALADGQRAQEVDAAGCHAVMMRKQEDLMLRLHRAEEALQHSTRDYILCRLPRTSSLHKEAPACQLAPLPGVHFLTILLVDCTEGH